MTRRGAIAGGSAAGALALTGFTTGSEQLAASAAAPSDPSADRVLAKYRAPEKLSHMFEAPKLLNTERAYAIMDKYGLDGLVASVPHNIQYLSSHLGPMTMMGRSFSVYAFFPRNESAPPALIVPGSMVYHLDYRPTWMPIEVYTFPGGSTTGKADPLPSPWARRLRPETFNDRDLLLMAIYAEFEGRTSASPLSGLAKALTNAGLAKGKIGFDDPRVGSWLNQELLPDVQSVDALNIFPEIRMVKTPNELTLLREASVKNEEALLYAIHNSNVGDRLDDIEQHHNTRWGALGGDSLWCVTNQSGLASGRIAKDTVTKIDSVGQYEGYRGDVGRTVVWGTPTDEVILRLETNSKALATVYDAIHPGMTFAESGKIVADVFAEAGIPGVGGPHPVGLQHTDQPWSTGADDVKRLHELMIFEENMVFTMDVPYHEPGLGTSHVEDMMVVKANGGCEPLSSGDTSLIVRPA
ncbi:M24 family metallopeptidase [Hyphomonas johnsonii]|nr:M24 family metallopeptidase [Hyphomonas johnsonii]